jgi:hypothetical protein
MTKVLTPAAMVAAAAVGIVLAPAAQAQPQPPCAAFDTCKYMPNPWYDGPLLPAWDVPGYYAGWTNTPVICEPIAYTCRGYVPDP